MRRSEMNIDFVLLHTVIDHATAPVIEYTINAAAISYTNIFLASNDIQSSRKAEQFNKYFSADYIYPFTSIIEQML